jgi:hypothetical protein
MKAQDFLDWADKTGNRHAADLVRETGMSRNDAQKLYRAAKAGEDLEIRQTLALAMSAIAAGLKPWGEREAEDS